MIMTLTRPTKQAVSAKTKASEFEQLFEQHWERLCRVLFRITGDAHEAQDLVLEAFVRLYRYPPANRSNLAGWLYRVATNLGFNALRANRRRLFYETEAVKESMLQVFPANPEEDAGRRMEIQHVRHILRSMKPRLARLLVLRHSGLTYAELAKAEGVRPGSVGTMLARAEKEFEHLYRTERSDQDAP
jgi:RNA polymerase sigma-70 factor (ECF subfamily)